MCGIPADARASKPHGFLKKDAITPEKLAKVRQLDELAKRRGQTLAQMALVWVLRDHRVTSALIGASRPEQILENVRALENRSFQKEELSQIESILR